MSLADLVALHNDGDDTALTGETRYRVSRGIFRSRIFLEVEYRERMTLNRRHWRIARDGDIKLLEEVKQEQNRRRFSDRKVPIGQRVKANARAGFNRGAEGRVVFQEPCGGILWVQRDGADGPCWYHIDELDFIRPRKTKAA